MCLSFLFFQRFVLIHDLIDLNPSFSSGVILETDEEDDLSSVQVHDDLTEL